MSVVVQCAFNCSDVFSLYFFVGTGYYAAMSD